MAYSKKNYTGDGVTKLFTVTFPYIDPSHVTVLVNSVAAAFTFQSKYVIELGSAPGVGAIIQLVRNSNPQARLVDFQDDSMATEQLLNLNSDQLLFVAQEALDNTLEGTVVEQIQALADSALASAVAAATAAASISLPIPISAGGTGGTNPSEARLNLGLGSASTKTVGASTGNIPEIGEGNKLPSSVVPRLPGQIVQSLFVPITAWYAGTAVLPVDDSIPQDTEGFLLWTQPFTPTKATNKLRVEYLTYMSTNSSTVWCAAALFKAGVENALVSSTSFNGGANSVTNNSGVWEGLAGTDSTLTFNLRVGPAATASLYVNGVTAGRYMGGTYASYLRITEVEA